MMQQNRTNSFDQKVQRLAHLMDKKRNPRLSELMMEYGGSGYILSGFELGPEWVSWHEADRHKDVELHAMTIAEATETENDYRLLNLAPPQVGANYISERLEEEKYRILF